MVNKDRYRTCLLNLHADMCQRDSSIIVGCSLDDCDAPIRPVWSSFIANRDYYQISSADKNCHNRNCHDVKHRMKYKI